MDRRSFIAASAGTIAALALPALAVAEENGAVVVTVGESASLYEGTPVSYFNRPMVFFVETGGTGQNRTRRISARGLSGREASKERMQELVERFAIVLSLPSGDTKTLTGD